MKMSKFKATRIFDSVSVIVSVRQMCIRNHFKLVIFHVLNEELEYIFNGDIPLRLDSPRCIVHRFLVQVVRNQVQRPNDCVIISVKVPPGALTGKVSITVRREYNNIVLYWYQQTGRVLQDVGDHHNPQL